MTESSLPGPRGHDLILDLDQIGADLLPLVGGKAANLGVLTRAGLPVPGGFCLTTEAYREVVGAGLEDVFRALAAADRSSASTPAELAGRARERVRGAAVPAGIAEAVRAAYARLGPDAAVAVRSSATAEDLPFASFAGQQDTFLNVVGADAVLVAVRGCWASLWTDRAVAYREANGIDHAAVALAVVVQRMVDAQVAGILFTANPVTGRRPEAVIDASPGLGEAVVSGAANPDHFVVDTESGRILERRIGDKRVSVRALPGGGTRRVEQSMAGAAACLDDAQLAALADLGRQVETLYGAPQDIEWAIDGNGMPWLTQARPITTLYPVPTRRTPAPGTRVFFCFSLAQGLTRPITPMGQSAFRLIGSSLARAAGFPIADPLNGPAPYADAGQRLFVDITPIVRSTVGRELAPRVLDVMEARSATVLRRLFADPRFSIVLRSRRPLLGHVARVAIRTGAPLILLEALFRPAAALRRQGRTRERLRTVLQVPESASPLERLGHVRRILGRDLFPIVPTILPLPLVGFAMLALARRLVGSRAAPTEVQSVLRGLPNNVTTEMDLDLWALAKRIRDDTNALAAFTEDPLPELARRYRAGSLPLTAQTGLAEFLGRYGDRAVAEVDLGMPRWSEEPDHILGSLANYLRLTDETYAPDRQFELAAREAERAVASLIAKAGQRGRLQARLVRLALSRTRQLAGLREMPKFVLVVALSSARRQLSMVGTALAAAGRLDGADDIFFLDLAEAESALHGTDFRELVRERRLAYARELRRRHIPRVLLSDGTEPETLHTPGETMAAGTLVGSPASAGSVTGPARVILDPVGAHLEPGDILVAPSTDPGWTPLFLTAGGLVMEMGGPNSHGAVVAREYGIPAVVGVPDATSRLSTGQRITVDGAAGTVTPRPDE